MLKVEEKIRALYENFVKKILGDIFSREGWGLVMLCILKKAVLYHDALVEIKYV